MKKFTPYFYRITARKKKYKNWLKNQQQNIKVYLQAKIKNYITIIEIYSSYTWEILINALTVSSLIKLVSNYSFLFQTFSFMLLLFFCPIPPVKKEILPTNSIFSFITKITKNSFRTKNEGDEQFSKKIYGHHGIFRIIEHNSKLTLDITPLTSIRKEIVPGYEIFPFKRQIQNLYTNKGLPQGISGFSRRGVGSKQNLEKYFDEFKTNKNPTNFLNFNESDLQNLNPFIEENIFVDEIVLSNLEFYDQLLLIALSEEKKPMPMPIARLAWSVFEDICDREKIQVLLQSKTQLQIFGGFENIIKAQERVLTGLRQKSPNEFDLLEIFIKENNLHSQIDTKFNLLHSDIVLKNNETD